MSNQPNNSLFKLIHSMEKNELVYFKREINSTDQNQYLIIFNILLKMKTYSEKELFKLLPRSTSKNLSRNKNYLYNLILKSLRNYHAEGDLRIQIHNRIIDFHLLYHKGLKKEALKRLKLLKKVIDETNNLEIQLINQKLKYQINQEKNEYETNIELSEKINTIVLQLKTWCEMINHVSILKVKTEQGLKTETDNKHSLSVDPEIVNNNIDLQLLRNTINALSYRQEGNYLEAYQYIKQSKDLIVNNKTFQDLNPQSLYKTLSNNYLFSSHLELKEDCIENLKDMEINLNLNNRYKNSPVTAKKWLTFYSNSLAEMMRNKKFDEGAKFIIDQISPWFVKEKEKLPFNTRGQINYFFLICFFFDNQEKLFNKFLESFTVYCQKSKEFEWLFAIQIMQLQFEYQKSNWK